MQPTKDSIKAWLKRTSRSRSWLGEQLNVGKRTVDAWLSTSANIPTAKLALIERLTLDDEKKAEPSVDDLISSLVVSLTSDELKEYEAAALEQGMTLTAWVKFALVEYAKIQGVPVDCC